MTNTTTLRCILLVLKYLLRLRLLIFVLEEDLVVPPAGTLLQLEPTVRELQFSDCKGKKFTPTRPRLSVFRSSRRRRDLTRRRHCIIRQDAAATLHPSQYNTPRQISCCTPRPRPTESRGSQHDGGYHRRLLCRRIRRRRRSRPSSFPHRGAGWLSDVLDATRFRDNRRIREEIRDENGVLWQYRGPRFDGMAIVVGDGTTPDELRAFAVWLANANAGSGTAAAARRFTCKRLNLIIGNFWEDDELWSDMSVLAEFGNAPLGNLLSLLSVADLSLSYGECFLGPPPLTVSLLEALPRPGTRLTELTLLLVSFEAPVAETLVRVISQLRLTELRLIKGEGAGPPDTTTTPYILFQAVLQDRSEIALLDLHGFDLSTIEPECWDLLADNRVLKKLYLTACDLGVDGYEPLASALKRNTTLQKLILDDEDDDHDHEVDDDDDDDDDDDEDDDGTAQGRLGAFGEALAVNASLEKLLFYFGRIKDSDWYDLSAGLRQNRTLKVLQLPDKGLTPQGLDHLLETVRYGNSTLERVIVPYVGFELEQEQFDLACRFHKTFRASLQALQAGAADLCDAETAFGEWWPLLGSRHPTAKATVLFCLVRVRAEVAAQSLRVTSLSNRGGDGTATSVLDAVARGTKRTRSPHPFAETESSR